MLVHFSRREYRCQPGLHRPGCGGSTPPSRRVYFGLQALQRCSGLLNRRARGSTVATHHFADVAQQRQQQFRKLPGIAPRECESLHRLHFRIRGEIIIILRFERRVCRWESCRMHQFMGMWLNPNSRGSRLRIWQPWGCNSLHAHHFTATGFSGIADPGDLKSPSLPGASPGSPTGVWLIGDSRPIRLKPEQPWECKSPHADQFGMSTGQAGRTCLLNSGLPERECGASPRHSAVHARVAQREPAALYRIALDQCRVPERYRTRVPFRSH